MDIRITIYPPNFVCEGHNKETEHNETKRLMLKQYLISNIMKSFAFTRKIYSKLGYEYNGYDNQMYITRSNGFDHSILISEKRKKTEISHMYSEGISYMEPNMNSCYPLHPYKDQCMVLKQLF